MKINNITNYISAIKVWLNSVYSFNKNLIKNIPSADNLVSKLILVYFTMKPKQDKNKNKLLLLKKRQALSINNIFSSKPDIKHSNNYVNITVHIYNKKVKTINYIANYLKGWNSKMALRKFNNKNLLNRHVSPLMHNFYLKNKKAFSSSDSLVKEKNKPNKNIFINNKHKNLIFIKEFIIACKNYNKLGPRPLKKHLLKHKSQYKAKKTLNKSHNTLLSHNVNNLTKIKNIQRYKLILGIKKIINNKQVWPIKTTLSRNITEAVGQEKSIKYNKFLNTIFALNFFEYMKFKTKILKNRKLRKKTLLSSKNSKSLKNNKSKRFNTFFKTRKVLLTTRRKNKISSTLPYIIYLLKSKCSYKISNTKKNHYNDLQQRWNLSYGPLKNFKHYYGINRYNKTFFKRKTKTIYLYRGQRTIKINNYYSYYKSHTNKKVNNYIQPSAVALKSSFLGAAPCYSIQPQYKPKLKNTNNLLYTIYSNVLKKDETYRNFGQKWSASPRFLNKVVNTKKKSQKFIGRKNFKNNKSLFNYFKQYLVYSTGKNMPNRKLKIKYYMYKSSLLRGPLSNKKTKYLKTLNKVDKFIKFYSKDLYNNGLNQEKQKAIFYNNVAQSPKEPRSNFNKLDYLIGDFLVYTLQEKYKLIFAKDLLKKDMLYLHNVYSIYKTNVIFKSWFINSLCNIISKIYNKKVIFNIVCLKYIYLNSDILIKILSNKLLLNKRKIKLVNVLNKIKYAIEKQTINKYTYDTNSSEYRYIENFNTKDINLHKKIFTSHINLKGKAPSNKRTINLNSLNNPVVLSVLRQNKLAGQATHPRFEKSIINKKTSYLSKYTLLGLNPILSNTINLLKFKYVFGVKLVLKGKFPNTKASARSTSKSRYLGNLKHNSVINRTTSVEITKNHQLSNVQYSKINNNTQIGLFGVKGWINNN